MHAVRRFQSALLVIITSAALCRPVHAATQETSVTYSQQLADVSADGVDLDRMEHMLANIDEEAARRVFWIATGNLIVGTANLVGGSFAMGRGAVVPAIGAFAGSAFGLASGILGFTLAQAPFHRVYEEFVSHRGSSSAAATLAATERAWQDEAEAACWFRNVMGLGLTTVGALGVAFSAVTLITDLPLPSGESSTLDRGTFGTVLLGLSGFILIDGITALVAPGPIESSWQSYKSLRPPAAGPRVSFQLAPIRQGAAAGMTVQF